MWLGPPTPDPDPSLTGPPSAGRPKISRFFPSPAAIFTIASLSWGLLVEVRVWASLGSFCATPGGLREISGPPFGPPTLRAPTLRAPTLRSSTLWAPPFGPPTFKPHFSGFGPPALLARTLRAPTFLGLALEPPPLRFSTWATFAPLPGAPWFGRQRFGLNRSGLKQVVRVGLRRFGLCRSLPKTAARQQPETQ